MCSHDSHQKHAGKKQNLISFRLPPSPAIRLDDTEVARQRARNAEAEAARATSAAITAAQTDIVRLWVWLLWVWHAECQFPSRSRRMQTGCNVVYSLMACGTDGCVVWMFWRWTCSGFRVEVSAVDAKFCCCWAGDILGAVGMSGV